MEEYEEKPFTNFGQFGEGKLDLRVFNQEEYWVDVHGTPHVIEEMNTNYRRNVIIHLLTNARFFQSGVSLEQVIVKIGKSLGYEIESSFNPGVSEMESLQWLEGTLLMKRLRAITPDAPTLDIQALYSSFREED